jgi:hypothetical protein
MFFMGSPFGEGFARFSSTFPLCAFGGIFSANPCGGADAFGLENERRRFLAATAFGSTDLELGRRVFPPFRDKAAEGWGTQFIGWERVGHPPHLNLFLVYQRFVLLYCPFGLSEQEIDFVISWKALLSLRKHGWCSHAHQHN